MTKAFLFPGQGSQYIGMGKALYDHYPAARDVFDEVDNALSQNLYALMSAGDIETLNLTENAQPALMAVSMAVIRVLKTLDTQALENRISFVAGHSLGEYSALTATGVLSIADTARLLKKRGLSMQKAVPVGVGAMAAILGLSFEDVQKLTAEIANETGQTCQSANDNADGQVVISGHKDAVEKAAERAKTYGAKRALLLPVSVPAHCPLMAPAAQEMSVALAETDFRPPCVPVINNVTAKAESEPSTLRRLLVDQITGSVRWRESILELQKLGVTQTIEIGAGKVLCGLGKRIAPEIEVSNIETPDQIDAFLASLS
jgi:[acyl-carrier-protein] S-malonyltransferase